MRERITMAVSIMTLIDFYTAVTQNEITEDVIAKANELIAKDAADKEKARVKRAEKAKVADANVATALGFLTSDPQTCSNLVTAFVANGMTRPDEKPITPQYVARLMKTLVDDGKANRLEIKVQGSDGKMKKSMAYTLAE